MSDVRIPPGSFISALAALTTPAALALGGLVLAGTLSLGPALVGLAVTVLLTTILVRGLLRDAFAGAQFITGLSRGDKPARPVLAHPITPAEINRALILLEEAVLARRAQSAEIRQTADAVLDGLPDPLVMFDGNRRVMRANTAARKLLGGPLIGRDLAEILRNPTVLNAADGVLRDGGMAEVEFTFPVPVATEYSARISRLESLGGQQAEAVLALYDLTSIKRSEELRADFVANASHELRTPLSVLRTSIETLRGPAKADAEAREQFLQTMDRHALRMSRLVEDLLSLSRIEMDEHTLPSDQVEVGALLSRVAKIVDVQARAMNVTIDIKLPATLPVITADEDQLIQVFQNLVDNAIKYGGEGETVTLSCQIATPPIPPGVPLDAPVVMIGISDQGEGIAEEHLPRLTERFYRVSTARSRELGGTGLGLAIVKHIVNRHRGALEIDSTVGKGTTFRIYLPSKL